MQLQVQILPLLHLGQSLIILDLLQDTQCLRILVLAAFLLLARILDVSEALVHLTNLECFHIGLPLIVLGLGVLELLHLESLEMA